MAHDAKTFTRPFVSGSGTHHEAETDVARLTRHYDEMPYLSLPFPMSSPDHIEAVAWLTGTGAPDPSRCRVLELGCASGGNLLPHALQYPDSTYVGIDLSDTQIRSGQAQIRRLGLQNIELSARNLAELTPDFGQFDYIICHGVYSWVPVQIQQHILRICSENLTENGIAFISYNTYPGWKFKEVLRAAMQFRTRHSDQSRARLSDSRRMFDVLHRGSQPGTLVHQLLDEHAAAIHSMRDDYLAHEYLEADNRPCYFHEFVEALAPHRLRYLADSAMGIMHPHSLNAELLQQMRQDTGGDRIEIEQYLDFIHNRPFRRSLITRETRPVAKDFIADRSRIEQVLFTGQYTLAPDDTLSATDSAQDFLIEGVSISVRAAISKAAMWVMGQHYPAMYTPGELLAAARQLVQREQPNDAEEINGLLRSLLVQGAIITRLRSSVRHAGMQADRPVATPAALAFARSPHAAESPTGHQITNIWHGSVSLDEEERMLLAQLDGSLSVTELAPVARDRERLTSILLSLYQKGLLIRL